MCQHVFCNFFDLSYIFRYSNAERQISWKCKIILSKVYAQLHNIAPNFIYLQNKSIVFLSQYFKLSRFTHFFGPTPDFEIALKTAIFKIYGYARNGTSVNKNPFLRPLNNRYFCHITIMKWSRINKKSIKKCIFWDIFIFIKVSPEHSACSQFVLCGCLIPKLFLFSL